MPCPDSACCFCAVICGWNVSWVIIGELVNVDLTYKIRASVTTRAAVIKPEVLHGSRDSPTTYNMSRQLLGF